MFAQLPQPRATEIDLIPATRSACVQLSGLPFRRARSARSGNTYAHAALISIAHTSATAMRRPSGPIGIDVGTTSLIGGTDLWEEQ